MGSPRLMGIGLSLSLAACAIQESQNKGVSTPTKTPDDESLEQVNPVFVEKEPMIRKTLTIDVSKIDNANLARRLSHCILEAPEGHPAFGELAVEKIQHGRGQLDLLNRFAEGTEIQYRFYLLEKRFLFATFFEKDGSDPELRNDYNIAAVEIFRNGDDHYFDYKGDGEADEFYIEKPLVGFEKMEVSTDHQHRYRELMEIGLVHCAKDTDRQ